MPDNNGKLRVFSCHDLEDKSVVYGLYQRFLDLGWVNPWLDEKNLLPGQDRETERDKVLKSTDLALVFLSKQSLEQEGNLYREMRVLVDIQKEKPENSIFIIPVRLDACEIPQLLRSWYPVNFFTSYDEREEAYLKILKSMESQLKRVSYKKAKRRPAHMVYPSIIEDVDDLACSTFGGFSFVKIPKGKFIMGSRASNNLSGEDEHPQRPYEIPYNFWITCYPVSYEQFSEYAVSTRHSKFLPNDWKKKLDQPMVNVSWHEAVEYTKWLNKIFKREIPRELVFRLPTEAEWERVSRGDLGAEWSWGSEKLDDYLDSGKSELLVKLKKRRYLDAKKYSNIFGDFLENTSKENSSEVGNNPEKSTLDSLKGSLNELRKSMELADVGTFSPIPDSPFEVADMMGSIWEWTHSLYKTYPYEVDDGREDLEDAGDRVIRGAFMSQSERYSVRSARRCHALPHRKEPYLGFRIVVAPQVS